MTRPRWKFNSRWHNHFKKGRIKFLFFIFPFMAERRWKGKLVSPRQFGLRADAPLLSPLFVEALSWSFPSEGSSFIMWKLATPPVLPELHSITRTLMLFTQRTALMYGYRWNSVNHYADRFALIKNKVAVIWRGDWGEPHVWSRLSFRLPSLATRACQI